VKLDVTKTRDISFSMETDLLGFDTNCVNPVTHTDFIKDLGSPNCISAIMWIAYFLRQLPF
jgi:hypothetical protein